MDKHQYFGKKIILTSKHEKLKLLKPAFDKYVGCKLFEVNLDTDKLGTFSGEIERVAPPRETAMQKARLGMKETGLLIGIASEGSIGPDPVVPFIHSNIEHLVLVVVVPKPIPPTFLGCDSESPVAVPNAKVKKLCSNKKLHDEGYKYYG